MSSFDKTDFAATCTPRTGLSNGCGNLRLHPNASRGISSTREALPYAEKLLNELYFEDVEISAYVAPIGLPLWNGHNISVNNRCSPQPCEQAPTPNQINPVFRDG